MNSFVALGKLNLMETMCLFFRKVADKYLQLPFGMGPMHSSVAVTALVILLTGCSESIEESPAYQAACHSSPLRSVEQREKAMEDGYAINQQYNCIDKASFEATERQKAEWVAAHTPEAIAQQEAELAERRERQLAIMSGGQPLWDRALDRMTIEEVRKAFPEAIDNPSPGKYVDGSKSLLSLPDVEMEGLIFVAYFVFLNEELVQVVLKTEGPPKEMEEAHTRLLDSFQAKYGAAYAENLTTKYHFDWSESWMSNATHITLSTSIFKFSDQSGEGTIRIIYRVRPVGS